MKPGEWECILACVAQISDVLWPQISSFLDANFARLQHPLSGMRKKWAKNLSVMPTRNLSL